MFNKSYRSAFVLFTIVDLVGPAVSTANTDYLLNDDECRFANMETNFYATGTTFNCHMECAITYAGTLRHLLGDCCVDGSYPLLMCGEGECDTDGYATASCGVHNSPHGVPGQCRWQTGVSASAFSKCNSSQVHLYGKTSIYHCGTIVPCCDDGDGIEEECDNHSLAWAVAVAQAFFDASDSWTYVIDSTGEYNDEGLQTGFRRRIRGTIYIPTTGAPSSMALIEMPAGKELRGMLIDANNVLSGTMVGTGSSGSQSATIYSGPFEDEAWDIDGDGRFNELDTATLNSVVGTSDDDDPLYIPKFDINNNGFIEADDVDFFQAVVDTSLDCGILGDLDGDGDIDCNDYALMGSSWSYVIGDPNYLVESDADLDGDNDSTDYAVVYDILQPADVNDDGLVNTQDMTLFLGWWASGDSRADVNGDGIVNIIDYLMFLNLWNNPC